MLAAMHETQLGSAHQQPNNTCTSITRLTLSSLASWAGATVCIACIEDKARLVPRVRQLASLPEKHALAHHDKGGAGSCFGACYALDIRQSSIHEKVEYLGLLSSCLHLLPCRPLSRTPYSALPFGCLLLHHLALGSCHLVLHAQLTQHEGMGPSTGQARSLVGSFISRSAWRCEIWEDGGICTGNFSMDFLPF